MKRSRWLALAVVICMVISLLPITALAEAKTYTDEYGVWTYEELEDNTIVITGFKAARKNIVVPALIGGKPVRKLGDGLFKGNNELTMVVISTGITHIGNDAFSGCPYLEQVTMPNTLVSIGDSAFADCPELGRLYVPNSVTELGTGLFVGSDNVDVRCAAGSAMATYLVDNISEVANFKIVEVQQAAPAPVAAPADPVSVNNNLVTFEFGKTINGKREFVLVVEDLDPTMDLNQYLAYDNSNPYLRDEIYDALNGRFKLVSMTRYDGTTTEEMPFITVEDGLNIQVDAWVYRENDQDTVRYNLAPYIEGGKPTLMSVVFDSDNRVREYSYGMVNYDSSQVKTDENGHIDYSDGFEDYGEYDADGQLLRRNDYHTVNAHLLEENGSCVSYTISSGESGNQIYVEYHDGQGFREVVNDHAYFNADPVVNADVHDYCYVQYVNNVYMLNENYNVKYTPDGDVEMESFSRSVPVEEGVYENEFYVHTPEETRDFTSKYTSNNTEYLNEGTEHRTDAFNYNHYVVHGENVFDAQENIFNQFPNEPSENTEKLSEQWIYSSACEREYTTTNLATNETKDRHEVYDAVTMEDHTFVGDTGMYVGWDWYASNHKNVEKHEAGNDVDKPGSWYTVKEYKFNNGVWTKTEINISTSNMYASVTDLIENVKTGVAQIVTKSVWEYQYDPSVQGGADNWGNATYKSFDENEVYQDILAGTSTVTDGAGNQLVQNDAQEELLDILETLQETSVDEMIEEKLEEDLEQMPHSEELVEQLQDIMDGKEELPESNTDENIGENHDCYAGDANTPETSAMTLRLDTTEEGTTEEGTTADDTTADDTTADDTTADDTTADDTTADDTTVDDTTVDDTTADDTTADDTTADDTTADDTTVNDTTADDTTADDTTADDTTADDTTVNDTTADDTTADDTTVDDTTADDTTADDDTTGDDPSAEDDGDVTVE